MPLTDEERTTYSRQLALFGDEGQGRLKRGRVTIVGAGGLGTVSALYLAAAGMGTITVIDDDVIEARNLNRQIAYRASDRGRNKAAVLAERLRQLNPHITVTAVVDRISAASVKALITETDAIVDAVDDFSVRMCLNAHAVARSYPLFHGAVSAFYGQATTIIPGETPCLACIFPETPPSDETAVIGPTCGLIGSLQANDVIKFIIGNGDLIANRLAVWDGRTGDLDMMPVEKNPYCPVCGDA